MAHSSVTLAYPWGGFAPDSTLSIPAQITEDQAISLVGSGEARWPVGGAATSNAPQLYAWSANTVYATGQLVLDPVSGVMMSRNSTGTSGLSFDPTEAAFWTEVGAGAYAPTTGVHVAPAPSGSDDTATLQALLNLGGTVVLQSHATYLLTGTTGLTVDPTKTHVVGDGTTIDASGMSGGTAVTFTGSHTSYNDNATGGWEGIELAGPGQGSSVTGVFFGGLGTTRTNAYISLSRSAVHDFRVGVAQGSNAWNLTLLGVGVYNCGTCVDNTAAVTNAGERMGYVACSFFNSGLALNLVTGEHNFSLCSIDYVTQVANIVGPVLVVMSHCHIEHYPSATVPIQLSGTDPTLVVRDSNYTWQTQETLTSALTTGVAVTSLAVDRVKIAITAGDQVGVNSGAGLVDIFTASGPAAVGATSIPVTSQAPTHDHASGSSTAYNISQLPSVVVSSSATYTAGGNGALFEHVVFSHLATTGGGFATNGSKATYCWVRPTLPTFGNCFNPNNGNSLTWPAHYPSFSVQGAVQEQAQTGSVTAPGQTVPMDLSLTAITEYTVTTTGNFGILFTNLPAQNRTQRITIVIFNNSGGALGTITWPTSLNWAGNTWVSPATGTRRILTAVYAQSLGKWLVTAVSPADF